MSDLYNGIHEYNSNDIGGLILPTSFEDALSYDQQILWLYLYKQALLQAGDNIELHENTDGTVTISSTGGGATYTIRSTTPDSGFGSAYELINVDTGERAGSKINIPEAIDGVGITSIVFKETDPQGNNVYTVNLSDSTHYDITCPRGPQGATGRDGVDGQDGTNGTDGVGITSITFKETDAQGNNIYTVNLTNSTSYDITCPKGPQGATGPTGAGVATGGTTGQVLSKVSGTDYDTQWRDVHEVPSGGTAGQVLSKVDGTDYNTQWATPSGLPAGGGIDNLLVKNSSTDGDASWKTITDAIKIKQALFGSSDSSMLAGSQYPIYKYVTPYNALEYLSNDTTLSSGVIVNGKFRSCDGGGSTRYPIVTNWPYNLSLVAPSGQTYLNPSSDRYIFRMRFSIARTLTAGAIVFRVPNRLLSRITVRYSFDTYMRRSSDSTFSIPCTVLIGSESNSNDVYVTVIFSHNVELNYVADESFHIMIYGLF